MSYRRAFSTLGCPELTLDEVFALAERHTLDAVELRALGGSIDLVTYFEKHFAAPSDLSQWLPASRVKVAALDTSFKLIDSSASDREQLLRFLPWSEAMGVTHLRVFDGGTDGGKNDLAAAAETLAWWRQIRRQNGWKTNLMVETHDAFVRTGAIQRLIAAAPDAAILWDSHHTWKKGDEDPLATWRALKSHIVHVHVKDSISQPSGKNPYTYVLPGNGEFPAPALFSLLKAEFSGVVSMEWEKLWYPELAPLDHVLGAAARSKWW